LGGIIVEFLREILGLVLHYIYMIIPSYGWSIIIFTIIVKAALVPLTIKQLKSTKEMQKIQPELKKLQDKYKNDKEQLNVKQMELYKEHNINPFAGCLPLLIQFPIIIALFTVLREPLQYVFMGDAGAYMDAIGQSFLWLKDLSQPDLLGSMIPGLPEVVAGFPGILPLTSALLTYFSFSTMNSGQAENQMTKSMKLVMPVMILMWGTSFSAGLILYWTVSNAFQLVQQTLIQGVKKNDKEIVK